MMRLPYNQQHCTHTLSKSLPPPPRGESWTAAIATPLKRVEHNVTKHFTVVFLRSSRRSLLNKHGRCYVVLLLHIIRLCRLAATVSLPLKQPARVRPLNIPPPRPPPLRDPQYNASIHNNRVCCFVGVHFSSMCTIVSDLSILQFQLE